MPPQRFLHLVAALLITLGQAAIAPQTAAAAVMPVSPHTSTMSTTSVAATSWEQAHSGARPAALGPSVRTGSTNLSREIFGFALASSLSDPTIGYPSWNFSLLSTVAFFGLHVNWDGTLVADSGWNVWNSSALTSLVSTAHSNSTKVVLTIVLQDFQPGTPTMCAGLINRATTIAQAVAQVTSKHVDGLNIDYEGLNGTCQNGQTSRAMFTDFVRQVRAALPSPSYVSVDTYASSAADPIGFFDISALNANVDAFFVMAYDLEYSNWRRAPLGCSSFCLGPTAPLSGYYYNDTSTADQYSSLVPASKVILGVPYYGRKACVGGVAPNSYPLGSVVADSYISAIGESTDPAVLTGSYATNRDANDPRGMERRDTWVNTALKCTRQLYWDDVTSLGLKYNLVNSYALRGVGIWTLNYGGGAPELWAALANHFERCTSVAVSSSPASPVKIGTSISITGSASGCPNPRYQFWIQPPGGAWMIAQTYSTSSSLNWTTAGKVPGIYAVSVWVRDAAGSGNYDAYNSNLRYVLDSNPCLSASVAASPASPVNVGLAVKLTSTAAVCPNPRYQFWILPPGGVWTLAQPYGPSPTFNWSTAGLPVGNYLFSIWVRDSSSTASYDAYSSQGYLLTKPCSAVKVAFSPAALAPAGTQVTITGSASACPNPLYQFWISPPGGAWTVAQSYSANASFVWTTSAKPAGSYLVSVWVRDSNSGGLYGTSPNRYDAYNSAQTFTLTSPCAASVVTASPAAQAGIGTLVTITGTATGCPTPRYQFWILPPGGTWSVAQPYAATSTLAWNTSGKVPGVYRFSVWARDLSSPGAAGTVPNTYDSFSTISYTLSVSPCANATAGSAPITASRGTQVSVNGSVTGCPNPQYEFWLQAPGGTWTLVQGWSSSASFVWSTSGKAAGTYHFSVWTRDASSSGTNGAAPNTYDAFSTFTFTLT